MTERDTTILNEFKKRISPIAAAQLKRLIVFGSRARGEETVDSDLDLIALVEVKNSEIEKMLEDIAYQVMWDFDFKPILSLRIFAESDFKSAVERGFSFYRHVEKEGLAL